MMLTRGLKISRILHAGYVFECDQTQIAFDPIFENPFSRNCHAFPSVQFDHDGIRRQKFAAVFISHYHDDHCSLESLGLLDRTIPIYIYCLFEEMLELIRALGFLYVRSVKLNSPIQIGAFEVVALPALDVDVDCIFHIKAAGLNVLNVVDSWIDPRTLNKLLRCDTWDMVLWPFQTLREIAVLAPSRADKGPAEFPVEWVQQLKALNPRFIVPSSCQFLHEDWSWYNHALFPISYVRFENEIKTILPETGVHRLNPSASVFLSDSNLSPANSLDWVRAIGAQNVDYEYRENTTPPKTSEIAQRFPALTDQQIRKVWEYCQQGILEKHNQLSPPQDPYFLQPRIWKLSLYDHQGNSRHFYYRLSEGLLDSHSGDEPISWSTEIPTFKLYAALELGESLTTMYIRINDLVFESKIESEIQSADIVEDPLIRSLFTGNFGSYQRAQLLHLTKANSQNETRRQSQP